MEPGRIWSAFAALLEPQKKEIGTVQTVYPDGRYLVRLLTGATVRVEADAVYAVGNRVFVQSGRIVGNAPALKSVVIEV